LLKPCLGVLAIGMIVATTIRADAAAIPEIALRQDYRAARASSADVTGGNQDRVGIPAGQTVEIADLQGPGVIRHCWFTLRGPGQRYLSRIRLQIRWDDSASPAVDAPWGPFFALGHDECADVVSEPIVVMAAQAPYITYPPGLAAFNCYFPMPFRSRARISVINEDDQPLDLFYFHIDYQRHETLPESACYFHARYHTEKTRPAMSPGGNNTSDRENYVILDAAGQGHYIGCTLHVDAPADEPGKWYEGDDMIVVDGEPLPRAILGTGSEDYFGLAWGVRRHFQSPYFGTAYHRWPDNGPEMLQYGKFSLYRWHLPDPIPFRQSIRVSIEHGHDNDAGHRYSSVAYWYATKP